MDRQAKEESSDNGCGWEFSGTRFDTTTYETNKFPRRRALQSPGEEAELAENYPMRDHFAIAIFERVTGVWGVHQALMGRAMSRLPAVGLNVHVSLVIIRPLQFLTNRPMWAQSYCATNGIGRATQTPATLPPPFRGATGAHCLVKRRRKCLPKSMRGVSHPLSSPLLECAQREAQPVLPPSLPRLYTRHRLFCSIPIGAPPPPPPLPKPPRLLPTASHVGPSGSLPPVSPWPLSGPAAEKED